jgi:hypothetical protein
MMIIILIVIQNQQYYNVKILTSIGVFVGHAGHGNNPKNVEFKYNNTNNNNNNNNNNNIPSGND